MGFLRWLNMDTWMDKWENAEAKEARKGSYEKRINLNLDLGDQLLHCTHNKQTKIYTNRGGGQGTQTAKHHKNKLTTPQDMRRWDPVPAKKRGFTAVVFWAFAFLENLRLLFLLLFRTIYYLKGFHFNQVLFLGFLVAVGLSSPT